MAKTPQRLVKMISRHIEYLDHVDEMIRVKTTVPVENQAWHIQNSTVEFLEGCAMGACMMLDHALADSNCYAGFMYVGPSKRSADGSAYAESVTATNPEFKEWRRHYFTKV